MNFLKFLTIKIGNPIKQDIKKGKLREFARVNHNFFIPLDKLIDLFNRVIYISIMDVFLELGKIQG